MRPLWSTFAGVLVALTLCVAWGPAQAREDAFTNKDMADWSTARKEAFVADAVLMLGHVVHLSDPEKGNCILTWYFDDADAVNVEVLQGISDFPDYTPTSIIIALAQRECGSIPPG